MKKSNQNGFINLIIYLLIIGIFIFTLYACLDILNLIEVPEEYSVSKWLANHSNVITVTEYQAEDESTVENIQKNIRVETESSNLLNNTISSPVVNSYGNTSNNNGNSIAKIPDLPTYAYYYQLDDYAKIIYSKLNENLENMKSGTYNIDFGTTFDDLLHEDYGEELLNKDFQLAINALTFDNPELFYLDISKIYLLTKITTKLWTTTYEIEIGANNGESYLNPTFSNIEQVKSAVNLVNNQKARIASRASGSIENQIKSVHDYLVTNLVYDSSLSMDNIYNIYGALVNNYTVCEGYARAFKSIMDDLKIPCVIVCGTGINSSGETESHAWNYVMINNSWYAIDVTWDDPVIIGNGYISSDINYRYYLKGSNEFFKNHIEDGNIVGDANFRYPTLSVSNY